LAEKIMREEEKRFNAESAEVAEYAEKTARF